MIKTIFFPYHLKYNPYCDLVVRILNSNNIQTYKLSEALKHPFSILRHIKIINLNFYENIDNNTPLIIEKILFCLKRIMISAFSFSGIKIIYTMHNKMQHDAKYINDNLKNIEFLLKKANAIICLCSESSEYLKKDELIYSKVHLLSLPYYETHYTEEDITFSKSYKKSICRNNEMLCVFIGTIAPYKNIELIIECANKLKEKSIHFLIAGRFSSDSYKSEITNGIISENITIIDHFLTDEEMRTVILASDVMLFPFEKKSALNSSSIMLTFAYERTCISPSIGTIKDISNGDKLFSYDYTTIEEHLTQLECSIMRAYQIYIQDNEILHEYGKVLKEEIFEKSNPQALGEKYKKIYYELVGNSDELKR